MKVRTFLFTWAVLFTPPALAQDMFDRTQSCLQSNGFSNPEAQNAMTHYSASFLTSNTRRSENFFLQNQEFITQELIRLCKHMTGASYGRVLTELANTLEPERVAMNRHPTSLAEEELQAILTPFLNHQADHTTLTKTIIPTREDVFAVFKPELAELLAPHYAKLYSKNKLFPYYKYAEVLTYVAQSDDIIWQSSKMQVFPKGYARLAPYVNPGFPVATFTFVERGQNKGLSLEGFYKVGDRWVLMARAWRQINGVGQD